VTLRAVSEDHRRALLELAATRLGLAPLAKRLTVSDGLVAAWLSGHAPIPDGPMALLADVFAELGDPPNS
jgi:hypothetical protein